MTRIASGDMAQAAMLRRQTADLKAALGTQLSEVTTGRPADLARHLGGDLSALAGLDATLARLRAYGSATAEAALVAATAQAALGAIGDGAASLAPQLLGAATGGTATGVDVLAADARQRFDAAVAALNTRVGDRALFAGRATDGPALVPAGTILAALEGAVAGAAGPAAIEAAARAWFDDPAGFAATAYRGGDPLAPLPVAEGETVAIDVTAADPALRDTLRGLAMAALLDRGALAGQLAARADLMRRAGETLAAGSAPRSELAARLGLAEARIEGARTRNAAETTALGIARTDLSTVDPYEAATRLEDTRQRLEAIYTLTARLSRLSLTEYLR